MSRLVIIGGSDAGISAGLRAKEVDPTSDVLLVVADSYPNFSICGLPFYLSGETPAWRSLAHRTRADLEAAGLELLLDHRVLNIDPQRKRVSGNGPAGDFDLGYDRLVIGTGATPIKPPIRGIDLPGVHLLHTMEDSFRLHDRLEHVHRAAIVGAGYIGLEMVDALRHRGIEVELFEQAPAVLPTVDVELGKRIGLEIQRHGAQISTGVAVHEIERVGAHLVVAGCGRHRGQRRYGSCGGRCPPRHGPRGRGWHRDRSERRAPRRSSNADEPARRLRRRRLRRDLASANRESFVPSARDDLAQAGARRWGKCDGR